MSPHIGRVSEKSDGRMKCYKAKSVIFGQFGAFRGFLTTFGPLGTHQEFCHQMFYSAQLDMKIELGAKFHKK